MTGLVIDLEGRRVYRDEQPIHLTKTEWALLQALHQNQGRPMSHEALLRRVWGEAYGSESNYVHTYISRLRHKLENDPANPRYLQTETGFGYRLELDIPLNPSETDNLTVSSALPSSDLLSAIPSATTYTVPIVNHLPQSIQRRYVGRQAEQDALRELLLAPTRLISIYGRGGVGKTALACKVLSDLLLADFGGMVFLSTPSTGISLDRILTDFSKLVSAPLSDDLCNTDVAESQRLLSLISYLNQGRYILFLDNLESIQDPTSGKLTDQKLAEALGVLLEKCDGLRILVTSRYNLSLPLHLKTWERVLTLENGLPPDEAVELLRRCDPDGLAGIQAAPQAQLLQVAERTNGFPRALEAVVGLLLESQMLGLADILADEALFSEEIVSAIVVQKAIDHLDPNALRVMQAIALLQDAVPIETVSHLLAPYDIPDLSAILNRLAKAYFLRYEKSTRLFSMHEIDQDYCYYRLPQGHPSDRAATPPPFTRYALHQRAGAYFLVQSAEQPKPRSIDDLAPHLAAFRQLVMADSHEQAAQHLLTHYNRDLHTWGQHSQLVTMHEALQGGLQAPQLRDRSLLRLGKAFRGLGRLEDAIRSYERLLEDATPPFNLTQALALDALGWAAYDLGDFDKAVDYLRRAIVAFKDIPYGYGEANANGGIGWVRYLQGDFDAARQAFEDAIAIFKQQPKGERGLGMNLGDLGETYSMMGDFSRAIDHLKQSLAIAESRNMPREKSYKGGYLATVYLLQDDLDAAYNHIREARLYHAQAENNYMVETLHGLILAKMSRRESAADAFQEAVAYADQRLALTSGLYSVRYARGLAKAGLAVVAEAEPSAAADDYLAAKAICDAPGILQMHERLLLVLVSVRGGARIRPLLAHLISN